MEEYETDFNWNQRVKVSLPRTMEIFGNNWVDPLIGICEFLEGSWNQNIEKDFILRNESQ